MLANRTLQAASNTSGYQIQRSVRFRSAASAYLSRTLPTGNRRTWTWSGWVKRGTLSTQQTLFGLSNNAGSSGVYTQLTYSATTDTLDFISFNNGSIEARKTTTAVFRDPSAWYHVVATFDTTNATAADRLRIYVNGVRMTSFAASTDPSLNYQGYIGSNGYPTTIGALQYSGFINYFDGCLAEVNFVDGQTLTASSFGQTDLLTGIWSPKKYSGAYGTNGFYLDFKDSASATLLGYDKQIGPYSRNLRTSGTAIGGYTANGGLAAAFDGNISQPNASSARSTTPAAGYTAASAIGRDWGVGITKIITAFRIYSQNDGGFVGGTSATTNYKLQGSNDGTTYTDLMSPGTTTGATSEVVTVTSGITITTAYRYHRVIFNANGSDNYYVCELELYETGSYVMSPNDWTANNIALSGSTTISTFTSVGTTSWVAPAGVTSVQYLVVGGGGGGYWGGGGAGGFRTGTLSVTPGNSYTVTVGAGGASQGLNGADSVFSSITSVGGGAGPNAVGNGATGGSGGGGGSSNGLGGAGTAGQGFAGGRGYTDGSTYTSGGGGGGASQAGADGGGPGAGGKGGDGISSSISGSTIVYAGGGGGYGDTYGPGVGGLGSGSTPNRGGGGTVGGGGSGVVILSYPGASTIPTYDSMLDVPLGGGGVGLGNYCTLNPLSTSVASLIKEANLSLSGNSLGQYPGVGGTIYVSSGKWYWEHVAVAGGTLNCTFGFSPATAFGGTFQTATGAVGYTNDTGAITVGGSTVTTGSTFTSGDIIGVALDLNAGTAQFYKNNSATGAQITGLSGAYTPAMNLNYFPSNTLYLNCGQRPFTYVPPAGFVAIHTGNFTVPTIRKPNQYFDVATYSGTSANQTIINSGSMQPDFIWIKHRSDASHHRLQDSVRGITNVLFSSLTSAEFTSPGGDGVTAINSNGFTLGSGTNVYNYNNTGQTYVTWQWKKGSIPGLDIIAGSTSASPVAHTLGVKPAMMIVKSRVASTNWQVAHKSLAASMNDNYIMLNTTGGTVNSGGIWGGEPTSSQFYVAAGVNLSGNYIAYLFAEVVGFSKFGSYSGSGTTDGPFVYCGFRPKYIMTKRTDTISEWVVADTARDPYNVSVNRLYPNLSNVEDSADTAFDMLANGFKLKTTNPTENASGGTYIFMAFAEVPLKYALAR